VVWYGAVQWCGVVWYNGVVQWCGVVSDRLNNFIQTNLDRERLTASQIQQ
jgi:hypothetical protein